MDLLRFEPLLRQMLWGGDKIMAYKGLDSALDRVGESWELSALSGHETVVAEGPDRGLTLSEMVARYREQLVGRSVYARFGDRFPLLVKFIDAAHDLSIQVHPDDVMAARHHDGNGKAEMWYVIDADTGAGLLAGFQRPVTPEEYDRRVRDHSLVEVLRRYEVRPGDLYYLPAGCVHNIGAGVFTVEIQQTSDLTYRIWDFDRKDRNGLRRELHTELAREAIDYDRREESLTHYDLALDCEVPLVAGPYFSTSLYELTCPRTCDFSALDSFVVMVFVEGEGRIGTPQGRAIPVRRGQTILVPASVDAVHVTPAKTPLRFLTACVR